MNEIIKSLSSHVGVSEETARTALGAVVAFLKGYLPEGASSEMLKRFPDANGLIAAYEANKSTEGGGLMGAVTGLATKVFGEGAGQASRLMAMLQRSGLDLKQIESFLPKAAELMKAHLPADLYDQIVAGFPSLGQAGGKP